jgi:hypothetical protein
MERQTKNRVETEDEYLARLQARIAFLKHYVAVKSGRTISAATRTRLGDIHKTMSAVLTNLADLMATEDPESDGSDSEGGGDSTGMRQGA